MITLRNLGLRPTCRPINNFYRVLQTTHSQAAVLPSLWSDNNIESYNSNTRTSLTQMSKKKSTEQNTNGNGSICYQNALNFTLKMCEKHKPETQVSERHKPGFRVWQNKRVSPGPGFSKTRVSIPTTTLLEDWGYIRIFPDWGDNPITHRLFKNLC